jgi:hypothetical protein
LKDCIRYQSACASPTDGVFSIKIPPYRGQGNSDTSLVDEADEMRYRKGRKYNEELLSLK